MNDFAILANQCSLNDFVFPVDVEGLGLCINERSDKVDEVFSKQLAGILGDTARHIGMTNDVNAVCLDRLAKLRQRAVTTGLNCKINNHRTIRH